MIKALSKLYTDYKARQKAKQEKINFNEFEVATIGLTDILCGYLSQCRVYAVHKHVDMFCEHVTYSGKDIRYKEITVSQLYRIRRSIAEAISKYGDIGGLNNLLSKIDDSIRTFKEYNNANN